MPLLGLRSIVLERGWAWRDTPYKKGVELTTEQLAWSPEQVKVEKKKFGFMDCSELTQYMFHTPVFWKTSPFGKLPDGATAQRNRCRDYGAPKLTRNEALQRPGALCFIRRNIGKKDEYCIHVAVSLGDGRRLIHAWSAGVKPSNCWETGGWVFDEFYDPIELVEGC